MNATDLFGLPDQHFHSSESFWSSLFVLRLLEASNQRVTLKIPVYQYSEQAGANSTEWEFKQCAESLVVAPGLIFTDVVVEGKIGRAFADFAFEGKQERPSPDELRQLCNDFGDLRPDIVLRMGGRMLVIETKTIGADITSKERRYLELCERLNRHGDPFADFYFLISAGHERNAQVRALGDTAKIILWEMFFKVVAEAGNFLGASLGLDLRRYYDDEALLHGRWSG